MTACSEESACDPKGSLMHAEAQPTVVLGCGQRADREAVRSLVEAAGWVVDDVGSVWVVDSGVPELGAATCWIALVETDAAALEAVRAGASDALLWPSESPRLGRALVAARHRLREATGHHIYREVFRRSRSWLELADDEVHLLDVSRGFEEETGYARAEAVGRTPADLFRGGTHRPAYYEAVVRAVGREGSWRGDMLGRRRDGSLAVLEVDVGKVVGATRTIAQFAEKRPLGGAGPASLGGWIERHVADPWLLVERQSGAVAEVGPRVGEVFGLDRQAILARPLSMLGFEVSLPGPGCEEARDQWIDERAFEVVAAGHVAGDVELVLYVFRDVTDRLRREEELDALAHDLAVARDQALAADRTKSAFLASMSHELRTPLTAILGYAEMLADDVEDEGRISDLGRIRAAGSHLLGLVDEVLDLARVESGEVSLAMGDVSLRTVLEEVVDSVRMRASAAGKVLVVDAPDGGLVWADRQRVVQVVLNLVVNAVKYAVPGRIVVGLEAHQGRRAVFVQDQGPGLTARQRVGIFHAFRQLRDDNDGVGLGLAISLRLAEAMGGSLDVVSDLGSGSRFRLWLRAVRPQGRDG